MNRKAFALFVYLCNAVAMAQSSCPSPRIDFSMTFDGEAILLHGGYSWDETMQSPMLMDDLWRWNGLVWAETEPSLRPARRLRHASCFDSVRNEVVLFGGMLEDWNYAKDVWIWDGTNWFENTGDPGILRGEGHLSFDSARGVSVLYVGDIFTERTSQTWEFDGSEWTQRLTVDSPGPRLDTGFVYDASRQVCVLFGGVVRDERGADSANDETWEYDGINWSKRDLDLSPSPRFGFSMAYDSERARVVLFGGQLDTG
ncbi:MAG TPA: kelch repeat-containing protein, partial [bacterium]|nr:kelch repeat-containing protein [bacterium]